MWILEQKKNLIYWCIYHTNSLALLGHWCLHIIVVHPACLLQWLTWMFVQVFLRKERRTRFFLFIEVFPRKERRTRCFHNPSSWWNHWPTHPRAPRVDRHLKHCFCSFPGVNLILPCKWVPELAPRIKYLELNIEPKIISPHTLNRSVISGTTYSDSHNAASGRNTIFWSVLLS
jgi:hypothetical protein